MLRFYLNLMSNTLICPIQNNDQHDTNRMFTSYLNIKTCNAWYPQNGQANIKNLAAFVARFLTCV